VGEAGVAVGVDLEPIRNLGKRQVRTAIVDLLAPDALERIRALHGGPFRLVASDMAPKTIGVKITDEARSLELVRMALRVAEETLAPGGAFVAKVFMGGDFPALKKDLQARFETVQIVRPQATRESSYEVYVLGKGYRGSGRVR
jgi:23S rRNA (uridine2552-2'-O)-methyltransferase